MKTINYHHCEMCGADLTAEQTARFQAKARFTLRRHQRKPAGPFCSCRCRAQYRREIALAELGELEKQTTV